MEYAKSFESKFSRLLTAVGAKNDLRLANALNISQASISSAKKRQQIPTGWVELISEKYNISADWIFFGRGAMRAGDAPTSASEPYIDAKTCGCDVDLIMIPRVTARLSAGTGSMETDGDVKGLYAFRADWILRKGNTDKMVLMDVIGDSMSPEIKNGDMVLIDQGKKDIFGYGYYAVGFGEEVYVKQIHTTPKDIILRSLNPQYEDITVSKMDESTDELRIIGRVIWIGREVA